MITPDKAQAIVAAAGGKLIGRTRLQKSAYFLEALGLGAGFDFSYHYYGPYSDDLAIAATDAEALGLINVTWETSQYGLRYAVYGSDPATLQDPRIPVMSILGKYDAIALELAATTHFLKQNGYADDAWAETKRRKSAKATNDRVDKAKQLLAELNL